ncbi:MAG: hypothetical protein SWH54_04620 [Thermodesulfobacteriota bacterium]|nr:hypothetical protein [Thermodesulfobacteriota bacterium]
MAVQHGNDGIVKVATNAVAEVQKWTYEEEDVALAPITSMGDTEETYLPSGCKRGGGSIECLFDDADPNGQDLLVIGSSVSLKLYPANDSSGDVEYSGDVYVEKRSVEISKEDPNAIKFDFKGVLAKGTVV